MSVEDRRLLRHVLPGSRSQRRRVAYLSLAASGATLFREPSASSHVAREHPVHNPLATVAGQLWPYQRCRASQIHIKLAMTSPYQVSKAVSPPKHRNIQIPDMPRPLQAANRLRKQAIRSTSTTYHLRTSHLLPMRRLPTKTRPARQTLLYLLVPRPTMAPTEPIPSQRGLRTRKAILRIPRGDFLSGSANS